MNEMKVCEFGQTTLKLIREPKKLLWIVMLNKKKRKKGTHLSLLLLLILTIVSSIWSEKVET